MAIHAHSTTAPVVQPRISRGGGIVPCQVLTTNDLLEEIRRTIEGQEALASTAAKGLLPPGGHARTLHMRRELHRALDYGFALLDALDLPPLALDVIDDAIATLDAMDAPDEDREDSGDSEASLGWTAAGACSGYDFDDREHDTADAELSCGWTAKVSQIHLGVAQDDHEDGHDAETFYEDGSEDEPYGWRFRHLGAAYPVAELFDV